MIRTPRGLVSNMTFWKFRSPGGGGNSYVQPFLNKVVIKLKVSPSKRATRVAQILKLEVEPLITKNRLIYFISMATTFLISMKNKVEVSHTQTFTLVISEKLLQGGLYPLTCTTYFRVKIAAE